MQGQGNQIHYREVTNGQTNAETTGLKQCRFTPMLEYTKESSLVKTVPQAEGKGGTLKAKATHASQGPTGPQPVRSGPDD